MQTENIDRIFEIEINGKAVPCAEAHIKRVLPKDVNKEIKTFYEKLSAEFLTYTESTLAPEFAERFAAAETVRERCALKIPVLTVKITAEGEEPLEMVTEYVLFCGARAEKTGKIRTKWDAQRGIMVVKKRANKKGST